MIIFTACASVPPQEVPIIKSKDLPLIEMKALSPKAVDLTVKNTRKINIKAGNSKAIEDKILDVLSGNLAKSNISVDPQAKTKISVEISDYENSKDQGECVQMLATVKVKKGKYTGKAYSCYVFKDLLFGPVGGDISEAYNMALKLMINLLNEQSATYEDWFN